MKILNLYAGLGGNRRHRVGHAITAVEIDPAIAGIYHDLYPDDCVVADDAHQFLLKHYREYDFIWSSPPCPSHSQYRYNVGVRAKGYAGLYPDMTLWQEIIFLQYHAVGQYVVENTVSYYEPLIPPQKVGRHYLWANFQIPAIEVATTGLRDKNKIGELQQFFGLDLSGYKIPNKRQLLRNLVAPELGLHVLLAALRAEAAERERDDLVLQIKAMRSNIAEIERVKFENMPPLDWRPL